MQRPISPIPNEIPSTSNVSFPQRKPLDLSLKETLSDLESLLNDFCTNDLMFNELAGETPEIDLLVDSRLDVPVNDTTEIVAPIGVVTRARSRALFDMAMQQILAMPNVSLQPASHSETQNLHTEAVNKPNFVLVEETPAEPLNTDMEQAAAEPLYEWGIPGPSNINMEQADAEPRYDWNVPGPSNINMEPAAVKPWYDWNMPGPSNRQDVVLPSYEQAIADLLGGQTIAGPSHAPTTVPEQIIDGPPNELTEQNSDFDLINFDVDGIPSESQPAEYLGGPPYFDGNDLLDMFRAVDETGSVSGFAKAFTEPENRQ